MEQLRACRISNISPYQVLSNICTYKSPTYTLFEKSSGAPAIRLDLETRAQIVRIEYNEVILQEMRED